MYINELSQNSIFKLPYLTKRQIFLLQKMNIMSVYDIINYFPFRYEDRSSLSSIQESIINGKPVSIIATVIAHEYIYFNQKRHPKILIQDENIRAYLVGFNREYLRNSLKVGHKYYIYAQFSYKYNEIQTANFDFEEYNPQEKPKHFGFILPIYRLTEKMYIKEFRGIIKKTFENYLEKIDDELPQYVLKAHNLISKREALFKIHFPEDVTSLNKAKLRLAYEEFFSIQLAVSLKKMNIHRYNKKFTYEKRDKLNSFLSLLPYSITEAQKRVIREIIEDMNQPKPMHRLIQGDVGSGKTTVAVAGMICAAENGYQTALMVPTEVLAIQHYENLKPYFEKLGISSVILTGSLTNAEKENLYNDTKEGHISIVIGTHALIQEGLYFRNLSLIVFDEQHRFGVDQRISLSKKAENPDILVMTATPIPRTLTLTVYGDLDLSVIDEMPAGRKKIVTQWITKKKYSGLMELVEEELQKGRQAYFIYPLIEESEKIDTENAIKMHKVLQKHFSQYRVGLLHGRMSALEKQTVMDSFRKNEIQILVSTSVIEVGIDVKNATVMVIEGAERFGLSQLHQLRGRVGRGEYQSYCLLVTSGSESEDTEARMNAMISFNDGFKIAEEDLKLRGPGEILGVKQSGLPELKIADYIRNEKLLSIARQDAQNILKSDPDLSKEINQSLKKGIIDFIPSDYLYSG